MKIVNGTSVVQVWTGEGRLKASYPTGDEAAAYLSGYLAAVADLTQVVGRTFDELQIFLAGGKGTV
jgi:hypothetical protein